SLVKLREWKTPDKISDKMLVLSDVAAKALGQVQSFVTQLLAARMPEPQAAALAKTLSEGRWTHDYPTTAPSPAARGVVKALFRKAAERQKPWWSMLLEGVVGI